MAGCAGVPLNSIISRSSLVPSYPTKTLPPVPAIPPEVQTQTQVLVALTSIERVVAKLGA
jgi:hypothetical protein